MASCLVKRTQNPVLWPNEQLSIDCPCILPSNSMADCSSQHNNITTRSTQCSRTGLFSLVSFFLLFSPLFLHLFSLSLSRPSFPSACSSSFLCVLFFFPSTTSLLHLQFYLLVVVDFLCRLTQRHTRSVSVRCPLLSLSLIHPLCPSFYLSPSLPPLSQLRYLQVGDSIRDGRRDRPLP